MPTSPLAAPVVLIARQFWRGAHWTKTPSGPRLVREPLKHSHIERHVENGPAVGLAPITPGTSTTRVAVLDFDSHKGEATWEEMVAVARRVVVALREANCAPVPFRSSGGRGIHLYCFWQDEQDAFSVRTLLVAALAKAGLANGTKGVKAGEAEVFPKQDDVPLEGVGNMIVLPLTGESVPLDDNTLDIRDYSTAEEMVKLPLSEPVPVVAKPTVQAYSMPVAPSNSLADVRSALAAIPNEAEHSLDYDAWRNIVFAIHYATDGSDEGLALAIEFSARSPKFDETFLRERVWPYVRTARGGKLVTERSLFDRARKHGWVEPVLGDFDDLNAAGPAPAEGNDTPTAAGPDPSPAPAAPAVPHVASSAPRYQFVPHSTFANHAPPRWRVKGVLPDAELALVIGQSGAGKSFIALDLAFAIAQGVPWRGRRVRQGVVAYVAAEGAGGFRNRLQAYQQHFGLEDVLPFHVLGAAPNLLQKEDVRDLIAAVKALGPVDVVFLDTFAQMTAGGDENSAEDMGRALGHCKALHRACGATIVPVHHLGKDVTKGARGWSGMHAAADAVLEVARGEGAERAMRISKQKDGEDGEVLPFRLEGVTIGTDADGDEITSCVVHHVEEATTPGAKREPRGPTERLVWRVAHDLAELGGGDLTVAAIIEGAVGRLARDPAKRDRRRDVVMRALQALATGSFLAIEGDLVRLPSC